MASTPSFRDAIGPRPDDLLATLPNGAPFVMRRPYSPTESRGVLVCQICVAATSCVLVSQSDNRHNSKGSGSRVMYLGYLCVRPLDGISGKSTLRGKLVGVRINIDMAAPGRFPRSTPADQGRRICFYGAMLPHTSSFFSYAISLRVRSLDVKAGSAYDLSLAVGSIMSIRWVMERAVSYDSFCTAQGEFIHDFCITQFN